MFQGVNASKEASRLPVNHARGMKMEVLLARGLQRGHFAKLQLEDFKTALSNLPQTQGVAR